MLLLAVPVGIAATVLYQLRWRINLLSLNDKDARALGVAVVSSATQRFGVLRIFGRCSGGGQRQYCLGWISDSASGCVCWWGLIIVVYYRAPSGWGADL